MADIKVNDIFDELIEENLKITECLNVLIRFKSFVDMFSDKLKINLESKDLKVFQNLHKEIEEVFGKNKKQFSVNKTTNQTKLTLIESLSSKPQTTNENSLHLTSEQSIDSKKEVPKRWLPRTWHNTVGCRQRFKSRSVLGIQERIHNFKCEFEGCSYSARSSTRLKDHINTHKGIKPFSCDFCSKRFTNENLKQSHIDYIHKVADQPLVCGLEECRKEFTTEHSLKIHQNVNHLMEKRFVCKEPNCSFRAAQSSILDRHFMTYHSEIRRFHCPVEGCLSAFKLKSVLTQHMKSHTSERNFKCEFEGCHKAFKTSATLRIHTLHHCGPDLKCEWPGCEYTAKTSTHLWGHRVRHKTEKNVFCDWPQCGKAFKSNTRMLGHRRVHTKVKDIGPEMRFVCSFEGCNKVCTTAQVLRRHSLYHSDFRIKCDWPGCEYQTITRGRLLSHQTSHSTSANFQCNWPQCGKQFKRKAYLETHERIHKNDKKFACSWPGCQYRCTDSGNLNKHKRVHLKQ